MKLKKSQLAVETLLIYGISILIVLLAIGALFAFGILDFDSFFPNQCDIDQLKCESYVITPTGGQFEFRNLFGSNIKNFTITIDGKDNFEGLWNCQETAYTTLLVNGELTNPPVNMNCDIKVPKGKKITGQIYINLTIVGSKINRIAIGKIRAPVS